MARPILTMLYPEQLESAIAAVPTLRVMTIGVILLAISQTTTGALQSIDRQMNPVKNLAIGACAKVVITYLLVGVAAINVKGAAIGTNAAYLIALFLNMRSVKKSTGVKFDIVLTYVKPMAASLIMGICVYASYILLLGYTKDYIATIVSIFCRDCSLCSDGDPIGSDFGGRIKTGTLRRNYDKTFFGFKKEVVTTSFFDYKI